MSERDPSDADRKTRPGVPSFTPEEGIPGRPMPQWTPSPGRTTARLEGAMLVDRYRILEQIGEGGMGTVYRAEHVAIGKAVAIKLLRAEYSERPDLVERFTREARAAPRIGHDNIVDITDFGVTPDGRLFFVMEYLEGEDLARLIDREGAQPWSRVRRLVLQICSAMAAAHETGVIHRDVKPANVFRTSRGAERDFVKIVDFGIAKIVEDDEEGSRKGVTQTGAVLGSIEYISPEQARGLAPDRRADVYAVGVMMYELLTGRLPFKGSNRLATLNAVMFEDPLPLRAAAPDAGIAGAVEDLVLRTMSKEAEDRPQSMRELFDLVERLDPAGLEEAPDRSGLWGWVILAVGAVLVTGVGLGLAWWRPWEAPETPPGPAAAPVAAAGAMPPEAPSPAPSPPKLVPAAAPPAEPGPASPRPSKPEKKSGKEPRPGAHTVDPEAFERRINGLLPRVRECGVTHAAAVGTVVPITVDVAGDDGRPRRIEIGGAHAGTPFGDCVQGVLTALRFAPFRDEKATFEFKYRL